jgi:hypothetical protein
MHDVFLRGVPPIQEHAVRMEALLPPDAARPKDDAPKVAPILEIAPLNKGQAQQVAPVQEADEERRDVAAPQPAHRVKDENLIHGESEFRLWRTRYTLLIMPIN